MACLSEARRSFPSDDFHAFSRRQHHGIVNGKTFRHLPFGVRNAQFTWVGQHACQRRRHRRFGTDQVALVVLRSRPIQEVPIVCTDADCTACRAESLSDARATRGFQDSASCRQQVGHPAFHAQHAHHLAASRSNPKIQPGMDLTAAQNRRYHPQVTQRTVRAGTNHHLGNRQAGNLRNWPHVRGIGGASRHGNQFAQIQFDNAIVNSIIVSTQFNPIFLALPPPKTQGRLSGGERCGHAHQRPCW